MEIKEFVVKFADQFDDEEPSEFSETTEFKNLGEWSSLTVMSIIAMVKMDYGVSVSGVAVNDCNTVADVFSLVEDADG